MLAGKNVLSANRAVDRREDALGTGEERAAAAVLLLQGKGISESMPRDGWRTLVMNQPPPCWSTVCRALFAPVPAPAHLATGAGGLRERCHRCVPTVPGCAPWLRGERQEHSITQPCFHPCAPCWLRRSQRGSLPVPARGPECATAAPASPSAPQHLLGGGCAFKEMDFAQFSQQFQARWSLGKQLRPGEMSLSELF